MQTTEGGEFVDASGLYLRRGGVCPRFNLFFFSPPSTIYTERWNVNIHTERVYISRVHRA